MVLMMVPHVKDGTDGSDDGSVPPPLCVPHRLDDSLRFLPQIRGNTMDQVKGIKLLLVNFFAL